MKHLIIIGARGFGREVYDLAMDIIESGNATFDIKGFLDDKSDALDGLGKYPPILSSVEDYAVQPDDVFTCGLGEPKWRKIYIEKILEKGGEFITLIHPTALIQRNSHIGNGCIITHFSNVSCDTHIGNYAAILNSGVGHDAWVGDYCVLSGRVSVNGFVFVDDEAYLACGVCVAPHKKIGKGAFCGMGSVVISNVKPGITVFGNPAKKIEF